MKYENGQYLKLKHFHEEDNIISPNAIVIAKIIQKQKDVRMWYETIYSNNQEGWKKGHPYVLEGWKTIKKITKEEALAWTL